MDTNTVLLIGLYVFILLNAVFDLPRIMKNIRRINRRDKKYSTREQLDYMLHKILPRCVPADRPPTSVCEAAIIISFTKLFPPEELTLVQQMSGNWWNYRRGTGIVESIYLGK